MIYRLQVTCELMEQTLKVWQKFFRNQWTWMGNCLMSEEAHKVESYKNLSRFGLGLMLHSIRGVQQARSQSLQTIRRKLVIFPNEDEEDLQILKRVFEQINLETEDWNTLVERCSTVIRIVKKKDKTNRKASFGLITENIIKLGLKKQLQGSYKVTPRDMKMNK